jgi:GT2 family glycosyltransferase
MTRISVVVPTCNRLAPLRRLLAAVERQEHPLADIEVIVVADGCSDGTVAFLRSHAGPFCLRVIDQENRGPAAARNRGIALATGRIIVFIDDDVVPAPDCLAEHARAHAAGDAIAVLGPLLTPADHAMSPWVAYEQAMLEKQYRAMTEQVWTPTGRQFYTGNASVARRLLLAAGGFDERFRRAEDVELGYRLARLGVRFVFNPRARAYHYAARSFESWLASAYAYGRNDVVFCREGERWLLPAIRREFAGRHPLNRALARLCLDRPGLSRLTIAALAGIGRACHAAGLPRLSSAAHGALFNLRYYQGVCDGAGGRDRVLNGRIAAETGADAAPADADAGRSGRRDGQ